MVRTLGFGLAGVMDECLNELFSTVVFERRHGIVGLFLDKINALPKNAVIAGVAQEASRVVSLMLLLLTKYR